MAPKDLSKIETIAKKYQFIYSGFHAEHFYWEIIIMLRKIAIIAAGVFLSMSSAQMQTLIMISILTLSLLLHLKATPYHQPSLNTLETYSHLVILLILYAFMIYQTSTSSTTYLATIEYPIEHMHSTKEFLLLILLLPNILFFLIWAYHFRLCVLRILYSKAPSWLFSLLACQKPATFARRHMKNA